MGDDAGLYVAVAVVWIQAVVKTWIYLSCGYMVLY